MTNDPEDFARKLQQELADTNTGMRKYCMRSNHCARKMTCEHAQQRQESATVEDLYKGKKVSNYADCENWYARRELRTELDVPRNRKSSGTAHNLHAPREAAHRELLHKIQTGQPLPITSHTPEEVKKMLEDSKRRKR